jgi:antitoxin component of RelBE/YafQ-DinJ toxin-antitoxin module
MERVQISDSAAVRDLKEQIARSLNIPVDCITLSKDAKLVRAYMIHNIPKHLRQHISILSALYAETCI